MRSLSIFVAFLLTLSAVAQPQPFDAKAVDKVVVATMKAWQIPGAAVAVVINDRVTYVQGYGTKELGGTEPVTPDTLFQIASASKAFTSTSLAMLATDKKLSFDDPVKKHLDYFRLSDMCADSQVTIRDIVSHRTGLGRRDELWDNTPLTREEVIRAMGSVELVRPFRSGYGYHNIMFITAGEVVARASGMPWDDFVKARIFTPLGMTRTVTSDGAWNAADHATGYRYDWKSGRIAPQRPIETHTIGAGGAIKSSARDMANWLRFHLAGGAFNLQQLVDPELLQETKTPQTVIRVENSTRDLNPESNVMSYAMGWVVQDYRGEMLVSHSGSLNGFRAHVDLLPERKAGFVILSNLGRGYALVALRNALADMLSQKPSRDWNAYYLMVDRRIDEKEEREKQERLAKRTPNTTPTHPLERYTGTYENAAYGKSAISLVDGRLVLQWNRLTVSLQHFEYDTFRAESEYDDVDENVTFGLNEKREVKTLTLFGVKFDRR